MLIGNFSGQMEIVSVNWKKKFGIGNRAEPFCIVKKPNSLTCKQNYYFSLFK